jgi:hypothetical protein
MALLFEPRLKMLGDPFISFQFAFEATDVFETAINRSFLFSAGLGLDGG